MARHYSSKPKMSSGEYAGESDRHRMEARDAHMIHEDHSAIANLPQNVMIKDWPMERDYPDYHLDDTIEGINHQMKQDSRMKKSGKYPEMY